MLYLSRICTVFFIILMLFGCNNEAPVSVDLAEADGETVLLAEEQSSLAKHRGRVTVERAEVAAFQPAGSFGGGVLVPGTFFPPTHGGTSILRRSNDGIAYTIRTTGLPPGAYTNWWIVINNPEECDGDCGEADIFGNPATNSSVFWATGGIVRHDGVGNFRATIREGQPSKGPDGFIIGDGLKDAANAEVHLIIKYHGPVSEDPDELYLQTHTLTGLCEEGANAYDLGPPFGVQCFDPQAVAHRR